MHESLPALEICRCPKVPQDAPFASWLHCCIPPLFLCLNDYKYHQRMCLMAALQFSLPLFECLEGLSLQMRSLKAYRVQRADLVVSIIKLGACAQRHL